MAPAGPRKSDPGCLAILKQTKMGPHQTHIRGTPVITLFLRIIGKSWDRMRIIFSWKNEVPTKKGFAHVPLPFTRLSLPPPTPGKQQRPARRWELHLSNSRRPGRRDQPCPAGMGRGVFVIPSRIEYLMPLFL